MVWNHTAVISVFYKPICRAERMFENLGEDTSFFIAKPVTEELQSGRTERLSRFPGSRETGFQKVFRLFLVPLIRGLLFDEDRDAADNHAHKGGADDPQYRIPQRNGQIALQR